MNFRPSSDINNSHHHHKHHHAKHLLFHPSSPSSSPSTDRQEHVSEKPHKHRVPVSSNIYMSTIRSVIDEGANVNAQNKKGKTPLMYACRYGLFDLVQHLLMKGSNAFIEDKKGRKCSYYAKKSNCTDVSNFVKIWMKTNQPQSAKFFLSNEKDLKPFLEKKFSIPKDLNVDLTKREYSDFVVKLQDALIQDAIRVRDYLTTNSILYQRPSEDERTFNILSIDGGGVRALAPALIVQKLWDTIPGFMNRVDLIVGSSGGATVAAGLANGLSAKFCVDFFEEGARKTFAEKNMGLNIAQAKYSRQWQKLGYYLILGNTKIRDLNKKLLIPAWKLEDGASWGPKFFHNMNVDDPDSGCDDLVMDAVLRSGAAPTYFSSYQGYIDCGVFANNPMTVALPYVIGKGEKSLGIPAEKIRVFSIGTGVTHDRVREQGNTASNWGVLQWGPKMLSLLFDGQSLLADQMCGLLLDKEHYYRISPSFLDRHKGMDSVDLMTEIKKQMQNYPLDDAVKWVHTHFK